MAQESSTATPDPMDVSRQIHQTQIRCWDPQLLSTLSSAHTHAPAKRLARGPQLLGTDATPRLPSPTPHRATVKDPCTVRASMIVPQSRPQIALSGTRFLAGAHAVGRSSVSVPSVTWVTLQCCWIGVLHAVMWRAGCCLRTNGDVSVRSSVWAEKHILDARPTRRHIKHERRRALCKFDNQLFGTWES